MQGDKIKNPDIGIEYLVERNLNQGFNCPILLCNVQGTGCQVVLKKIPESESPSSAIRLEREIKAGTLLHHKNIVQFLGWFRSPTENLTYLILEYIPGMDLLTFLQLRYKIPEPTVKELFGQIITALEYCHSLGIAHRDIKLDNIMINDRTIKLIDFGFCDLDLPGQGIGHLSSEWLGSSNYAPPEILNKTPYNGFKVDIWCSGVVLYTLLYKEFPFLIQDFIQGKYIPIVWPDHLNRKKKYLRTSDEVKDLIMKMLNNDPNDRLSITDIKRHSWML